MSISFATARACVCGCLYVASSVCGFLYVCFGLLRDTFVSNGICHWSKYCLGPTSTKKERPRGAGL